VAGLREGENRRECRKSLEGRQMLRGRLSILVQHLRGHFGLCVCGLEDGASESHELGRWALFNALVVMYIGLNQLMVDLEAAG
jgi:hypothetical protein